MMTEEEIKQHLKMAFWDVNYSPDTLFEILTKKIEKEGAMTIDRIYQRLLETFSWYKIIELIPKSQLNEALEDKIIQKFWRKELKQRYEHLKRILHD